MHAYIVFGHMIVLNCLQANAVQILGFMKPKGRKAFLKDLEWFLIISVVTIIVSNYVYDNIFYVNCTLSHLIPNRTM